MISELGIIVLAGGLSTRMGTDKTRLPWGSTTLLGEMLRKAGPHRMWRNFSLH